MNALLIIAHGSRRQDSNDEVRRLTARIRERSGPAFSQVVCAFLEISSPQVDSAIAELATDGVSEIKVFPYFLSAGTHVATDIPRLVAEGKINHPNIRFEILPHLGALQDIGSLILEQIQRGATASA